MLSGVGLNSTPIGRDIPTGVTTVADSAPIGRGIGVREEYA